MKHTSAFSSVKEENRLTVMTKSIEIDPSYHASVYIESQAECRTDNNGFKPFV